MGQLSAADVKAFKVVELRAELKARDLDTSGLKAVLQKRLLEAVESELAAGTSAKEVEPEPEQQSGGEAPDQQKEEKAAAAERAEEGGAGAKRAREEEEEEQRGKSAGATERAAAPPPPSASAAAKTGGDEDASARSSHQIVLASKRQKTTAASASTSIVEARVDANGVRRFSSLDAPIMCCEGHKGEVFAMKFSPDGGSFATGAMDREVFVWNVRGECDNFLVCKGHKSAVVDLHWTTDGDHIVTASPDKTVRVWDVQAGGIQVKKWAEHQGFVNACSPARRGHPLFVSGSDDGTAKIWDQRRKRSIHTCQETYQVTSVSFSDQTDLVFTAGLENVVKVWDMRKYEVLYELKGHSDTITGMSLSHDGNFLLTNAADDTLRVWDVRPFCSAQSRCTRVLTGHVHTFEKNLLKCAWSKDDTKVTAGSGDALVNIWDVGTGSLLYKLPGHQGSVNEAVFHPREKILGSCGTDGKIFLGEVDL